MKKKLGFNIYSRCAKLTEWKYFHRICINISFFIRNILERIKSLTTKLQSLDPICFLWNQNKRFLKKIDLCITDVNLKVEGQLSSLLSFDWWHHLVAATWRNPGGNWIIRTLTAKFKESGWFFLRFLISIRVTLVLFLFVEFIIHVMFYIRITWFMSF